MKTRINNLLRPPALIAGLVLMVAGSVTAQTFTTLYSFTGGSDGVRPYAGLILSSNILYGTTTGGGSSFRGTVFAVTTDGSGFANLYNFTGGSDGAYPYCPLILSGNTLYGTAFGGGSGAGTSGSGTVFAVNTDGTGFTTLYSFTAASGTYPSLTNSDGVGPDNGLILSGNTLYGTAALGGISGEGTVFAVNTDGTGFTNLHNFTPLSVPYTGINSDGANPHASLILSGNTLYGAAGGGGSSGHGTVFKVNTDGTGFATLYSFTGGSDGAGPWSGLILSGNTLYGTAELGGISGNGTVFAVNTDGTGFTTLHRFTAVNNGKNIDGYDPQAGLILSDNTLYGAAGGGGSSNHGTVFKVNTDGTGFATLYSFTALVSDTNNDGARPVGGLILSGNTLYGTAWEGGSSGLGTVFSITLPPQLTIIPSGANVVLAWPTNAAGFTLQSTTNLGSLAFWTTNSPVPVVVNGQNTVTNPISGAQQFYRLSQ
jgi:uncharacterized repeat protein (TIGR03803 family)